ncbi:ribokinase [Candidatus Villigracilis saccharophilus]|uniref:ribokinase n=1 Tax=Candidatus Villigracilis saccharophilus TaxID=3140684 RepID=UPI003135667A|nr:ribokinase [Anaerolineales bacterium]
MSHTFKYDILVIGSLNADLVVRAPHFPRPGETISGDDLQIIPGGKGANQAVAAARQGANVGMIGRVGKDGFGDVLLQNLKNNRVDISDVERDDASTGTAIIVVDEDGQNSIILSAGANGKVTREDVKKHSPGFQAMQAVLLQLEIPLETVVYAAQSSFGNDALVILNPAPARTLPDELFKVIDYLIPNETELSILSGIQVTDLASAEKAARSLQEHGNFSVLVTMGGNGALIVDKFDDEIKHIPAFKVEVVDTTAAGDAFIGGFASALLRGLEVEEAVKYANACGALAATKFGAQPSLPTKEEVEKFIKQG